KSFSNGQVNVGAAQALVSVVRATLGRFFRQANVSESRSGPAERSNSGVKVTQQAVAPKPTRWLSSRSTPVQLLVVAVTSYASAEVGVRLSVVGRSVTPLWPPTGVALVAMLILGRRTWPAIAIAAFVVNVPISPNVLAAATIALGNTLAPLVAVTLLGRIGFDRALSRVKDAFALVFVAALAG